jgi:hypothetical protein
MDGGEAIRYAGKVDSARYYAGENRLTIQYVLAPDPNIVQSIIYWNLKKEFVTIDLDRTTMTSDTVTHTLELPEGVYSFEIYNVDRFGNVSVPTYLTARTYGDSYINSLLNRRCSEYEALNFAGDIRLYFGVVPETAIGVSITYRQKSGEEQTLFVANDSSEAVLNSVDLDAPIRYTTCYIPEPQAIDTFAAQSVTLDAGNLFLKWSTYSAYKVTGFDNEYTITTLNNPSFLWDGKWGVTYTGGSNQSWANETGYQNFNVPRSSVNTPTWFTFDLAQTVRLARYRHHFYYSFQATCPLFWELWAYTGSGAPTAAEGWNNWVKIGEGNTDHLPAQSATNQQARIDAYPLGETISFERQYVPAARYYRFKCLENWYYKNGGYTDHYGDLSLSEIICWVYL